MKHQNMNKMPQEKSLEFGPWIVTCQAGIHWNSDLADDSDGPFLQASQ